MRKYLGTYGPHFNKALCEDAIKLMRDRNGDSIIPVSKQHVKELLSRNKLELKRDVLWDAVYVYSMLKADSWGSSLEDELHFSRAIVDYLDDADGYDGMAFNRWWADLCKKGIVLDWEDYL